MCQNESSFHERESKIFPLRPEVRGEGQLLQAMIAHWIHEDQLYWNQIRHLLLLQLTVFAAWFALGLTWLSVLVTASATIVCGLIYRLALVVARNRDANAAAINLVSRNLASNETLSVLPDGVFRFATHGLRDWTAKGRSFQSIVFGLCLAINAALAITTAVDLAGYKTALPLLHSKFSSSTPSSGNER